MVMMLDEALLRRLYLKEQQSIRTIAGFVHVSPRTVYDALRHYHIPRRSRGRSKSVLPRGPWTIGALDATAVRHLYLEEGQSMAQIATAAHCSPSSIRRAMIRWNISRRRRGRR